VVTAEVPEKMEFHLVALDCPSCGAPIAAEGEDVVYYCTACRNGYRFDPEERRLVAVEVAFVSLPHTSVDLYKPFWLVSARVSIEERLAAGGAFSGLMSFFLGDRSDSRAPAGEGTFAIPAFPAPLAAVTELTRRYTEALPELGERLGERLLGGCYEEADAHKLAHFVLIATEVDRPDTLQDLRYDIEFGEMRLLGVPFVRKGETLADALFGIRI
jgi:hypothetical protein